VRRRFETATENSTVGEILGRRMSQTNVEVMRKAMEAFNQRDGGGFDALLSPDAEIVPVRASLEGTTYRGGDAGTQYCAAVEKTWQKLAWEVEELRDQGDVVLALGHIRGQGRDSGVAIDSRAGWLARFREGRIKRFQTYADRNEALKTAGLRE
jgi:ketosteroid isomerase-like protein